jgi:hypothetical protein
VLTVEEAAQEKAPEPAQLALVLHAKNLWAA